MICTRPNSNASRRTNHDEHDEAVNMIGKIPLMKGSCKSYREDILGVGLG